MFERITILKISLTLSQGDAKTWNRKRNRKRTERKTEIIAFALYLLFLRRKPKVVERRFFLHHRMMEMETTRNQLWVSDDAFIHI